MDTFNTFNLHNTILSSMDMHFVQTMKSALQALKGQKQYINVPAYKT